MTAYRAPLEDTLFLLRHVVDRDAVLALPGLDHVDAPTLEQVVEAAARFAEGEIAPLNEPADREGCALENGVVRVPQGFHAGYRAFCEQGWPALALPEAHGGQGLPEIAQAPLSEFLNGASVAFSMVTLTGRAGARTVIAHGTEMLKRAVVPRLASGEWAGVISMTEPGAGSDIGLLRSKAKALGDGRYALTGTKIFISFADHELTPNIIHLALARIEGAPPGPSGLSLFLVPKFRFDEAGGIGARNGMRVARLEEKLGIHGSPTCVVEYDGAEGWLLGEPGRGLNAIFTMVNTMRLEVSAQGVAVSHAALVKAAAYALERRQGAGADAPSPIAAHPDVRRMLLLMRGWTEGGRALVMEIASLADHARLHPDASTREAAAGLQAFLLPIAKAGLTDAAQEVTSMAIQIHGGYGYCREQGVEQLYRDARIMPIYEGTNGIQAIDLALRKLVRDKGKAFERLRLRIRADLALGGDEALAIRETTLEALAALEEASEWLMGPSDQRTLLAAAPAYMALATRVALGWMWHRMAITDAGPASATKRVLAQFWAEQVMVECPALALKLRLGPETLDALPAEALAAV